MPQKIGSGELIYTLIDHSPCRACGSSEDLYYDEEGRVESIVEYISTVYIKFDTGQIDELQVHNLLNDLNQSLLEILRANIVEG